MLQGYAFLCLAEGPSVLVDFARVAWMAEIEKNCSRDMLVLCILTVGSTEDDTTNTRQICAI